MGVWISFSRQPYIYLSYRRYCKKEVKTQLGYAANLFGMAEEEHAVPPEPIS